MVILGFEISKPGYNVYESPHLSILNWTYQQKKRWREQERQNQTQIVLLGLFYTATNFKVYYSLSFALKIILRIIGNEVAAHSIGENFERIWNGIFRFNRIDFHVYMLTGPSVPVCIV